MSIFTTGMDKITPYIKKRDKKEETYKKHIKIGDFSQSRPEV